MRRSAVATEAVLASRLCAHMADPVAEEGVPHHMACTPDTVCWGYMDAAAPPRLTVPSGARVVVDCMDCGGPAPTGAPRPELPRVGEHPRCVMRSVLPSIPAHAPIVRATPPTLVVASLARLSHQRWRPWQCSLAGTGTARQAASSLVAGCQSTPRPGRR